MVVITASVLERDHGESVHRSGLGVRIKVLPTVVRQGVAPAAIHYDHRSAHPHAERNFLAEHGNELFRAHDLHRHTLGALLSFAGSTESAVDCVLTTQVRSLRRLKEKSNVYTMI